MAQRISVTLLCDLHAEEVVGVETVAFAHDGFAYEIDACELHASELRDAFAPYVGAARRAGRSPIAGGRRPARAGSRPASAGSPRDRAQVIRDWARSNGHEVSERGRLSAVVRQAYDSAH